MPIHEKGKPFLDDTPSSGTVLTTISTRALALQEVATALGSSEDLEKMVAALLPVAAGAVGSRESALFVAESPGEYRLLSMYGAPADLRASLEESLLEQAAADVAGASVGSIVRAAILADEEFVAWCGEQKLEAGARNPYFELYAPLRAQDSVVGVLALHRRFDGRDFSRDDLRFVEYVCSAASIAVSRHILERENARQIEMLRALAKFTSEITATLDLNRVLATVANTTEAVVERDRALVALLEGGALKVRAVSDKVTVEANEAEVLGIADVLAVILRHRGRLHVSAEHVAEETSALPDREVFARYFESGEMQSILALPLQDEEGILGYLVLESRNPAGFGDADAEEFLGILSGSVSVAIRNADLYRRLPMVGFLAPLASQRRRLDAMNPRARALLLGGIAAAVLFVAAVPLPRNAVGPAVVRPSEVLPVTALAPGIVERVYAKGGERLVAGSPVASLRNTESSARLAAAEADLKIAQRRAAEASQRRDPAEVQRWSLEAQNLAGWMAYARSEEQDQRLTAPVTGSILTPRIEEKVGEHLERGDVLCEVARLDPAHVEVQISEEDV
ncbi:MAG TPA: GAF domain-containing protein, partial [Candidatus Eisenbacteria bacterium]|nr:GAF domain-containing protein [Candidatus Eisenbacteria bacterium]